MSSGKTKVKNKIDFFYFAEFFSGKSYLRGPWFLTPPEVPGSGNRFFYRQELMMSTVRESSPIIAVVGRCAVLDYTEYTTSNSIIQSN